MGLLNLAERSARAYDRGPSAVDDDEATPEVAFEGMPESGPATAPETTPPAAADDGLKALVEFIPTESIVLFWLAVPAARSLADWLAEGKSPASPTAIDWGMLVVLIALTPALLLLAFLSQLAREHKPRPPLRRWPWWRAAAATIAFACWVFAVPGNPFVTEPALLMSAWVGSTFVSMVLGMLDPIIVPPPLPPVDG